MRFRDSPDLSVGIFSDPGRGIGPSRSRQEHLNQLIIGSVLRTAIGLVTWQLDRLVEVASIITPGRNPVLAPGPDQATE